MVNQFEAIAKLDSDRVVDNRTYVDPAVYKLELERVFDRCWLFVAHESELPEPGDYVTARVAENPIVVARDRDGSIHAFHNVCRHRGAMVALESEGHCSTFRCPYHFWTYSLRGELLGIPGEEAYDGTGFEKENFPLVPVNCDVVLGLVFVHFSDDAPSLRDWLGPEILQTLSTPLGGAQFQTLEKTTDAQPVNWKVFAENARDGYHVPFVHPFFRKASPPGMYHLYRNSHAVQDLGMDFSRVEPELAADLQKVPLPGVEVGGGYIANIFPDLAITLRSNVVSINHQSLAGPAGVVFENRTLGLVGDDEPTRRLRRLSYRTWFADPVELEDMPVFHAQQAGVSSRGVRYSVIARGRQALEGTRGDDNRLRHFWVTWRKLMGVERNSIEDGHGER